MNPRRRPPGPGSVGRRREWLARAGLCALSTAAFAIGCALLRPLVPWPEDLGLRAKFEYFREHKDEFDLLLIGSSQVFRAFDPEILDAQLADRGLTLRSFNFGVGGMGTFEAHHTLREALALRPARLRYVLVEGSHWLRDELVLGQHLSRRLVFWHGIDETILAIRSELGGVEPIRQKLAKAWAHVQLCVGNLTNLAQGPPSFAAWAGSGHDPYRRALPAEELARGRGYEAPEVMALREPDRQRNRMPFDPSEFAAHVVQIPRQDARDVPLEQSNLALIRSLERTVHAAGATMMVVVPPGFIGEPGLATLHRAGLLPRLLDLNRPKLYPELFRLDHRWDQLHMNRVGADAATKILARLFANELDAIARER